MKWPHIVRLFVYRGSLYLVYRDFFSVWFYLLPIVMMIMMIKILLLVCFIRCQKSCNRSAEDLLVWIKNKDYDGSVRPNMTGKQHIRVNLMEDTNRNNNLSHFSQESPF